MTSLINNEDQNIHAASPHNNAAVLASAGTGKTWLLVTRMIRLLLCGVKPDSILAITFTRKAAAEMLSRLQDRLREYALLDDADLHRSLSQIGVTDTQQHLGEARSLLEQLLFAYTPVRTTTFHSFCQSILQRFPIEANTPPGFELIENTFELDQQAWDALFAEATLYPDGPIAKQLEILFDHCGSIHNTRNALLSFLYHRNDWYAYTQNTEAPLPWAKRKLLDLLDTDDTVHWHREFFSTSTIDSIDHYASLLEKHATKTNLITVSQLRSGLDTTQSDQDRFNFIIQALLTKVQQPKVRKSSKAQQRSMGERGETMLLQLHTELCDRLLYHVDQLARLDTYSINCAWLEAGVQLLHYYQRIKNEQRVLDFNDLEWKTYQLLTNADNALWVQYKLDQSIDHFLIDEFQDTNPIQWKLLLPLLSELSSGETNRHRSVFLVGDEKQSIYRFRRADPGLLGSAADWIRQTMDAKHYTLSASRRSSPAVIEAVNLIFSAPQLSTQVAHFEHHDTHLNTLWGAVVVLPVIATEEAQDEHVPAHFRNPLDEPRRLPVDLRYHQEGMQIANEIRELIDSRVAIDSNGETRAITYSDIFIIVRDRSHVGFYEHALRESNIPFIGAERGTLLQCVEIQDMEALLTILVTPFDNLSLAQVLRSPLFSASDEDLMLLATQKGANSWMERLQEVADSQAEHTPLYRANQLLSSWQAWVGILPVHDLLDRIYNEANVLSRYEHAYPASLRPRVRANLNRFIELALEIDSGRYPSLQHFINQIRQLRSIGIDAPDQPPSEANENRVQILTIHAAKGLEAPVVFLADASNTKIANHAFSAIVDWPTGADQPRIFMLSQKKSAQDSITQQQIQQQRQASLREEANLLYVATTRARQFLYISGSEASRSREMGWYGVIKAQLETKAVWENERLVLRCGAFPSISIKPKPIEKERPSIDRRWLQIWPDPSDSEVIEPSQTGLTLGDEGLDDDSQIRGRAIHRLLDLLTRHDGRSIPESGLRQQLIAAFGLDPSDNNINAWMQEVNALVSDPQFADIFKINAGEEAYNEMAIQYRQENRLVNGVIDRIVKRGQTIYVVDYKTHRQASPAMLAQWTEQYTLQMKWYGDGVQLIWPDCKIRPILVFTAGRLRVAL